MAVAVDIDSDLRPLSAPQAFSISIAQVDTGA